MMKVKNLPDLGTETEVSIVVQYQMNVGRHHNLTSEEANCCQHVESFITAIY